MDGPDGQPVEHRRDRRRNAWSQHHNSHHGCVELGTATDGLGAGTITVSGTVNANSLTFGSASGAILLSGGTINLLGGPAAPTITVNNAANTISSVITGGYGTTGLTKAGTGALTLSGANTYSGSTITSAGTIIFTTNSAFGTSSLSVRNTSSIEFGANGLNLGNNVQIQNSVDTVKTMKLDLAGTNTGTLSGQLDIRLSSAGDFVINTGADDTLTVSGRVYVGAGSGVAGITKIGAGTLILSGTTNSYNGLTTVSAGVLNIRHGSALGSVSSGYGTSVTSGAALQIQGGITTLAEALTLNGTGISNDGALRNISGDNTYAGAITLNSATRINSASGTLTLDVATGNAITGTQNLTFGGAGNITVADAIATSTGTLTKDGTGTAILSGTNTYTGATTVTGGVLAVNGSLANTTTTVGTGATLQGSGSIGGAVTVSGTLAPGNSIESIGTGALSFLSSSTYAYELQTDLYSTSPGTAADLTYSSSTLDIAAGAILTLTDLATSTALAAGSKFTLISYFSGWEGTELFSYDSGSGLATLADDSTFTLGANQWLFNYNDTIDGVNFTGDQTNATSFVTITVIPEPNFAALLGGFGVLLLFRRRR